MAVQTPPNNDTIADALDITPVNEVKKLPVETSVPSNTEKDLDYARENYYHLIETGRRSLEDLVDVANQSQHPRAYEVIQTRTIKWLICSLKQRLSFLILKQRRSLIIIFLLVVQQSLLEY